MARRRFAFVIGLGLAAVPAPAFAQSSSAGDTAFGAGLSAMVAIFAWLFFVFYAVVLLAGVGAMVLWILMLVDVASRLDQQFPGAMQGHPSPNEKVIWLLVVLLGGFIGSAVYYFVVARPYPRTPRPAPPSA
jgi:TctA family transporter